MIALIPTILLGILALIAIAGCLLVLLDPGDDLAIRPMLPEETATLAGIEPVSGVPVSPTLHHIRDGRIPGPVTGRVARTTLPRHSAPGRATRRRHGLPNHAAPRLFAGSTL
jgi:hypothetical protein